MSAMRIGAISAVVSSATLTLALGLYPPTQASATTVGPAATAVPAVAVCLAKRQPRKLPIASLVKVMTAYVVLKEAPLSTPITITKADVPHAATNDATSAGLRPGENLATRDLLHALMLPSGADAANALARTYGPGTTKLIAKMNATAKSLGLTNTHYTN